MNTDGRKKLQCTAAPERVTVSAMNEQCALAESENEAQIHAALSAMYYAPNKKLDEANVVRPVGKLEKQPREDSSVCNKEKWDGAEITTQRPHKREGPHLNNATRMKAAKLEYGVNFEAGNSISFQPALDFLPSATGSYNRGRADSKSIVKVAKYERAADAVQQASRGRFPSPEDQEIAASLEILSKLPSDAILPSPLPLISGLSMRQDIKASKHLCGICGKVFKRAHNLKIHGRLHTGDKPYACPFGHCDKEFRWKSSLVSHLNWHKTKMDETLPGFDGSAEICDAIPEKVSSFQEHAQRKTTKTRRTLLDADNVAVNSRLKKALLQQSHAQARQTAALKAADDAIAAANAAAAEAASAADAAAKCKQEGEEVVAGEWAIPYAGKIWASPTSQQAGAPSHASATEEIVTDASKASGNNLSWLVSPAAKLLPSHSNPSGSNEHKFKEHISNFQDPLSNAENRLPTEGTAVDGGCSTHSPGYCGELLF